MNDQRERLLVCGTLTKNCDNNGETRDEYKSKTFKNINEMYKKFPKKKVQKIVAGGYHIVLLSNEGRVYVSGKNSSNQLGEGNIHHDAPKLVREISFACDVAAGAYHSLGEVFAAGDYSSIGWKRGLRKSFEKIDFPKNLKRKVKLKVIKISTGVLSSVYQFEDFSIYSSIDNLKIPLSKKNELFEVVKMKGGFSHFVFLSKSNEVYFYTCRDNIIEKYDTKINKIQNISKFYFKDIKIIDIGVGFENSLFLCSQGNVFAQGRNIYFESGFESRGYIKRPTIIPFFRKIRVMKIFLCLQRCFFLSNKNKIYAFGLNVGYQLGLNTNQNIKIPKIIDYLPPLTYSYTLQHVVGGFEFSVAHIAKRNVINLKEKIFVCLLKNIYTNVIVNTKI